MKRLALIVLVLLLMLAACSEQESDVLRGQALTPEEQKSLYDQRLEQDPEPGVSGKGVVYWTPSGTKYHKDIACSYIKNAEKVLSGTLSEAVNHGADSPCSRCAGG